MYKFLVFFNERSINTYRVVRILGVLLCLSILFSCHTEEDKYPEMPFFEEAIQADFNVKTVASVPRYFNCTKTYLYFKDNSTQELFIYKRDTKKLVHKVSNVQWIFRINKEGTIYYVIEYGNDFKGYELKAPYKAPVELEIFSFDDYWGYEAITKRYEKERKKRNIELDTPEFSAFLKEKRSEFAEKELVNRLDCIQQLVWDESFYIFFYKDGQKRLVRENYSFYEEFGEPNKMIIRDTGFYMNTCDPTKYEHFGTFDRKNLVNEEYTLSLLDKVVLEYTYTGRGGRFSLGIRSDCLYYYEFELNGQKVKFKTKRPIKVIENLQKEVIFKVDDVHYVINSK